MAKYELSDDQVKQIKSIINAVSIRGADAKAIVELLEILDKSVADPKPSTD